MKSTTISAATIALLASFSKAAPITQAVVNIQLEIESGTFIHDTVPFNIVFKTANSHRLSSGLGAHIQGTTGISDGRLGGLFTKRSQSTFSTNGIAVPIAAYLCSNKDSKASTSAMSVDKASVPNNDAYKAAAANVGTKSSATARIQLEFESDGFIQEEIPIGQLLLTKSKPFFLRLGLLLKQTDISSSDNRRLQKGLDGSVVGATGVDVKTVKCQAFPDELGKKPLGEAFSNLVDGVFTKENSNPVPIAAFKCESN
ncbi:MAG: hypothetical protein M1812_003872 [Candelaria pacifica]|nr:MAG: hypothetical protein M1812_003872 [Candelaria pacifica]